MEGRSLEYTVWGSGPDVVFILAGIHGNEQTGVKLARCLGLSLQDHPSMVNGRKVVLLPVANPDGYARNRRDNVHDVDLNRNFQSANWTKGRTNGPCGLSEPESRAVSELLSAYKPNRVVSLHQIVELPEPFARGLVDYDGPAESLAGRMAEHCPLKVRRLGSRPGSMGFRVGEEMHVPIITFEMPTGSQNASEEELWRTYGPALLAAIAYPDQLSDESVTVRDE